MSSQLERLQAALADRYRIDREIGHGGSSTVYLAHEVHHHRAVAIKLLRPSRAGDLAERFLREIEVSAALTHPYILPVLDSGQADEFLYYVMPYVEGESLRERLESEGPLPVRDAVRIAREVTEALAHAHAHDIIHRDIKPENVLLSGRHALVADFGVARALHRAADEEGLTETGVAVGTSPYMSPEQAAGDERVDARSDIYAVGCLLYEMLTGRPPLTARSLQATLARRMTETPAPIRHVRDTVPEALERVVMRALARAPADRFQGAESLARALKAALGPAGREPAGRAPAESRALDREGAGRPGAGPPAPAESAGRRKAIGIAAVAVAVLATLGLAWGVFGPADSAPGSSAAPPAVRAASDLTEVAVLPFGVPQAGRDLDYLAGGLTRSLIDELGEVEALNVRSYRAVEPYRGVTVPTDSLGRALQVGLLVGGTVEERNGGVQVRVELTDVETGTSLASGRVQRPRGEPFALQEEIAAEVAGFLREKLGVEVRLEARRAESSSPEAWELVERAEETRTEWRDLWRAGNVEAAVEILERADSLLARAASLDRSWVEPVVLRGWVAERSAIVRSEEPQRFDRETALRALEFAETALDRESGNARALELRGTIRYRLYNLAATSAEGDSLLDAAERDLRAAVGAQPSLASAWVTLSELLEYARAEFQEAQIAAERAYREDAFLREAEQILFRLASISLNLGEYEAALRWSREGERRFPENVSFPAAELVALASDEAPADAERAWELYRTISELSPPAMRADYDARSGMLVAAVLARAGREDSARATIRRTRETVGAEELRGASYEEARARLLLGDREGALAALARYLDAEPQERTFIAGDPWFDELRGDPTFQELVAGEG